jgi:uncharacterized hydantoinase/oxoprolinase family protein
MTKPFPGDSELIRFMTVHLVELFDHYTEAEQEGDESLMDYVQGSIDTTQVYLNKSGVKPQEYEDYLELANAEWKVAN